MAKFSGKIKSTKFVDTSEKTIEVLYNEGTDNLMVFFVPIDYGNQDFLDLMDEITLEDVQIAKSMDHVIKLLAIAELTPITAPVESTRGPPEFPGLIAASVCSALIKELSLEESPAVTGRFFALIIPVVTVPDNPRGEPIAITESPTAT